ncbi:MAG: DUF5697 family protein [Ruminococcus sp.]
MAGGIKKWENKQRPVIAETRELVQKYHVLEKAQIYASFCIRWQGIIFVGKAFKALEKERQVFIHPELEVVAASEEAIAAKDLGTMKAVWVLVDVMKKKQVEEHFPASKEEYPVRIVFYGEGEIFDILYISEAEVTVVNNLFSRKKIDSCGHIIVVENPDYISAIHIADVIGYCVVKEGGEVEYYQYSQGGSEE